MNDPKCTLKWMLHWLRHHHLHGGHLRIGIWEVQISRLNTLDTFVCFMCFPPFFPIHFLSFRVTSGWCVTYIYQMVINCHSWCLRSGELPRSFVQRLRSRTTARICLCLWLNVDEWWWMTLPSGNDLHGELEHGHRNSGFIHWKWGDFQELC